jgi:hypothetical protein
MDLELCDLTSTLPPAIELPDEYSTEVLKFDEDCKEFKSGSLSLILTTSLLPPGAVLAYFTTVFLPLLLNRGSR